MPSFRPACVLALAVLILVALSQPPAAEAAVASERANASCVPSASSAVKRMSTSLRVLARRAKRVQRRARVSAAAGRPRVARQRRARVRHIEDRMRAMRRNRGACRLEAARRKPRKESTPEPAPAPTPAPTSEPTPTALRVGLVSSYAENLGEVDWATSLNARIMRHEFKTAPDAWDDSFYRLAAQRGITIVPLINVRPMPSTDAAREAFAQMFAAHVERFGPNGTFWGQNPDLDRSLAPRVFELLNEPYIDFHAGGYNPAGYAALVKRGTVLARQADPDVRVAIALATTYFGGTRSGAPWLEALYEAAPDLNQYYDVAAVHPYAHDPDTCTPSYRWCFRQIEVIRSMLTARGASDKRVWITEIGNNTKGSSAHTEAEQAHYLKRYVDLSKGYGYVDAFLYYNYRDNCTDLANKECWFGLVRPDGSRKPAFDVLRQAAIANP